MVWSLIWWSAIVGMTVTLNIPYKTKHHWTRLTQIQIAFKRNDLLHNSVSFYGCNNATDLCYAFIVYVYKQISDWYSASHQTQSWTVWCVPILIYQGVHCCTKVCNLLYFDCKGSDTTWELRMVCSILSTNRVDCHYWWCVRSQILYLHLN